MSNPKNLDTFIGCPHCGFELLCYQVELQKMIDRHIDHDVYDRDDWYEFECHKCSKWFEVQRIFGFVVRKQEVEDGN